ncbi:MAG: acyl carrier protein [Desulfobacterales bacterium]|nr:MAG: acyl carrier protein [Desulfobacterales bacterium]
MARKIKALMSRVFKTETDAVHEDLPSDGGDPSQDIEHKIKAVMAKVFKIDINDINDDTSPDNVHQWTSLEHVDFVLNLQQEFEIEFTDSQIVEALLSYKTVVETVEAALEEKRARRAN